MDASTVWLYGSDVVRSPSFTLATALVLLGHDCPGNCPTLATESRCSVWFVRRAEVMGDPWTHTLVDVTFEDSPWDEAQRREQLAEINACVRSNHIRVRESDHATS